MTRNKAYQEAARRIEAAHQENVTEIDLNSLRLTELPEAIALPEELSHPHVL